jgi:DNA-directed RNA polymerase subunit beta'
MPTLDMVIGLFFLTTDRDGEPGEGRAFSGVPEAIMAFDRGEISLQSKVKIRFDDIVPPLELELGEDWEDGQKITLETTLGRALFNDTLPADYPFVNYEVGKKAMGAIINDLAERYTKVEVAASLDALKDTGFHWATRSGVTVSIDDVTTPPEKVQILSGYEAQAAKVQKQFERGLVTDEERRQELIEIWTQAANEVGKAMETVTPDRVAQWKPVSLSASSDAATSTLV